MYDWMLLVILKKALFVLSTISHIFYCVFCSPRAQFPSLLKSNASDKITLGGNEESKSLSLSRLLTDFPVAIFLLLYLPKLHCPPATNRNKLPATSKNQLVYNLSSSPRKRIADQQVRERVFCKNKFSDTLLGLFAETEQKYSQLLETYEEMEGERDKWKKKCDQYDQYVRRLKVELGKAKKHIEM